MENIVFILGKRLERLRKERGYSQEDVADMLKIKKASISNYESGKQVMPIPTAYMLADIFCIELAELLPTCKEVKDWTGLMEKIL